MDARDDRFDGLAIVRLTSWATAAAVALGVAVLASLTLAGSQRISRSMFAGSLSAPSPRSRTQYMMASIVACAVGHSRLNSSPVHRVSCPPSRAGCEREDCVEHRYGVAHRDLGADRRSDMGEQWEARSRCVSERVGGAGHQRAWSNAARLDRNAIAAGGLVPGSAKYFDGRHLRGRQNVGARPRFFLLHPIEIACFFR